MHRLATRLLPLVTLISGGLLVSDARSASNPGSDFKSGYAGDVGCISQINYGAIYNHCATAREVVATITVEPGWHPTSVTIYGNSTWCHTVTTNTVGNAAHIGTEVWTTAGPDSWQTLNTGNRYVWAGYALVFRCSLEPGGQIGIFNAD